MIGITVNGLDHVRASLKGAAAGLRTSTYRAVARGTIMLGAELRKEMTGPKFNDPFWGVKSGSKTQLTVRSGITRSSLTPGARVYQRGGEVIGAVGSAQKHLLKHEDGGTFPGTSPKGYARIPTAAAQTKAGVDRWTGQSIRDIPGAFLIRASSGKLWAVRSAGGKRSARVEFLYLLVKSYRLLGRKIFGRTSRRMQPEITKLVGEYTAEVTRKANT